MKLNICLYTIWVLSFYPFYSTSQVPNLIKEKSICKDTNYFIRKQFVYCDSAQPKSFILKKGVFYECKKHNYANEDLLVKCKTDWSDAKYFIFKTKNGKIIEEGYYSGIWEMTFCRGEYKAYYKNGNIKVVGHYDGGYKVQSWKYYGENGMLIREDIFEKGKIIKSGI